MYSYAPFNRERPCETMALLGSCAVQRRTALVECMAQSTLCPCTALESARRLVAIIPKTRRRTGALHLHSVRNTQCSMHLADEAIQIKTRAWRTEMLVQSMCVCFVKEGPVIASWLF